VLGSFTGVCYVLTFALFLESPWIEKVRPGTLDTLSKAIRSYSRATNLPQPQVGGSINASVVPSIEGRCDIEEKIISNAEVFLRKSLLEKPYDEIPITDELTCTKRFIFIVKLWPYMVPLFLLYWWQYSIQVGAWSTVAFNPSQISDHNARDKGYKHLNLSYQCAVFLARSCGSYLKANLCVLWILPVLQLGFLIFFIFNAAGENFVKGWILLVPAFCVGFIAGYFYVNAFCMLTYRLPKKFHEFALFSASQANSIGIMAANICSLYIQWCLFKANSIEDQAGGSCPF